MTKWKAVRIKQELAEEVKKEVEKSDYKGLSEFVADAIQQRLQTLAKQRVTEYLERDKVARTPQLQAQLFYTPKHVWAKMTPEGIVEVGVTEHFQKQLREIVNIRTDGAGEEVSKDEPFGVAESWWFTFDLYSPLNGKIAQVNKAIIEDPLTLNADPFQWIVKVQPRQTEVDSWTDGLLNPQKYQALIAKPKAA